MKEVNHRSVYTINLLLNKIKKHGKLSNAYFEETHTDDCNYLKRIFRNYLELFRKNYLEKRSLVAFKELCYTLK